MKNKVLKTIISVFVILLFTGMTVIAVNAQLQNPDQPNIKSPSKASETLDMLVFIAPQYQNDIEINEAVNGYKQVLKQDVEWNVNIIGISEEENNYEIIDQIIEKHYQKHPIKACIMVGEDLDTALAGDSDYMEKPSIVPWFTIGGKEMYERTEKGIVSKSYKMDICISLLYPTSELDYKTKKQQIISAFEKFSKNRVSYSSSEITVFESSDINENSKVIYKEMNLYSNLNYLENPYLDDLEKSYEQFHSMYFIHGHSNPAGTCLNENTKLWFSAESIDDINTPLFCADGCYTSGWWSKQKDNNKLDPSITATWYGEKIFTSKYIKTMALGLLSQNGYQGTVSFIENTLPELTNGKTLAESMIGSYYTGDFILVGDPTLHYKF